ncbi:MAG: bifunctional hydroxymethylpyrimidine kinase/phosphomethylpyrimidine kinase, partial [Desulfobacterales bacterium]|nr:bifunctional hydroxymethylpyrimidine kinase/phosphomethylpyrimidine kinase [Desulfobacterales bacterium]
RQTIQTSLLPLATVVTPNLPEAEVLCGCPVNSIDEMRDAARCIHDLGPRCVVIKGGHLKGRAVDLLFDGKEFQKFDAPRLNQRNTHGTGCTFSAALATILAGGLPIAEAVGEAKIFITRAISMGLDIGAGNGPTNPYAQILHLTEREAVLTELKNSLEFLSRHKVGRLVPEVRSNIGYALPGAARYDEIAAFPGRISQIGNDVFAYKEPAFGASRHIARVILAATRHKPHLKAAMNIRYSQATLDTCKKIELQMAFFDRRQEPKDVKEREGSTLEWGTDQALLRFEGTPDLIYDEGEVGKEPMIRILGRNPMEVAEKIIRIKQNL